MVVTRQQATTTEGGRRPRKLCASCGRNTAARYYWWLEQTSVRFLCRECRDARTATPRASPVRAGVDELLRMEDEAF